MAARTITNPVNTPANSSPLSTSSGDNMLNNLITPTINSIVLPILLTVLPILSMFLAASPFTRAPYRPTIPIIPVSRSPALAIPWFISSSFNLPRILTDSAMSNIAIPKPANPDFKPSILTPPFPIDAEADDSLSIT